jgi:preprotein translocase subunit SecB
MVNVSRRNFIRGIGASAALIIAAPSIVRADSIMKILDTKLIYPYFDPIWVSVMVNKRSPPLTIDDISAVQIMNYKMHEQFIKERPFSVGPVALAV